MCVCVGVGVGVSVPVQTFSTTTHCMQRRVRSLDPETPSVLLNSTSYCSKIVNIFRGKPLSFLTTLGA